MTQEIIYIIFAYLLGSIPTAVWLGKVKYNIDIREHGSKNAGATNTFRVLGKKPGILVLAIDIIKGIIAVSTPLLFGLNSNNEDYLTNLQLILGIAAVLGHIFPVFAQFNGGKGVATSLGIIIGIHPILAFLCLGIFLIIFVLFSYVSLGAISAALAFPVILHFGMNNENIYFSLFSILLSFAVIFAHKKNIKRLINGNENKINLFKK